MVRDRGRRLTVWVVAATAPYLHKGSVPTIAAQLDSARRPRSWRHAGDTPAYDQAALGWAYDRLEAGKAGTKTREERVRIYDADQPGYGNQGHDIGDDLDPEERLVLIEYLKTL
jgi:RoxA-like, cytochrome c-like